MKSFIKSHAGIATIITIIAGVLTAAYFNYVEQRSLSIAVIQDLEIASKPDLSEKGSLEFLFNGEKVSNLISVNVRIKNTGNVPIQEDDFVESLGISFPDDTRIINYKLLQVQPANVYSLYQQDFLQKISENQIQFTPILINPDDVFDINLLLTRNSADAVFLKNEEVQDALFSFVDSSKKPDPVLVSQPINTEFSYRIHGISEITIVPKIDINSEIKSTAQQIIKEQVGFILKVLIVISVSIPFMFLVVEIIKRLPVESKNEKNTGSKGNKTLGRILIVVFMLFVFGFPLYGLFKIIYEAYFL